MRRKLLCVSGAMTFGIWLAGNSVISAAGITLAAFLYCLLLYLHPEYDTMDIKELALCCVLAVAFGSGRMLIEQYRYADRDVFANGKVHEIDAYVIRTEKKPDKSLKVIVSLDSIDKKGLPAVSCRRGIITVMEDIERPWKLTGSRIHFLSRLEIPDSARNPRCFDHDKYLRSRGIGYKGSTVSVNTITSDDSTFMNKVRTIKGMIMIFLLEFKENYISKCSDDQEIKALLRGVIFGDTQEMTDDMKEDFRRNGTAHILAVSGLHIGLLYSIFKAIRKKGHTVITPVFFVMLLCYGTMTLWSVSVTRAVIMIIIMETGDRLDRRYDLLTSAGTVSMLVLIHNPYALMSASFMMSFLAVLSIGMIAPRLPTIIPSMLRTSLAVQAGLFPYTIYTFNFLPFASIIVNVPVIIVMTILVTICICTMPLMLFFDLDILSMPICNLSKLLILINSAFAEIGVASEEMISPRLFIVFFVYILIFFLFSETSQIAILRKDIHSIRTFAGLAVVLIMLSSLFGSEPFDKADIIFIDVGQGDCMHLKVNDSSNPLRRYDVLIDGGGSETYDVGKNTLKPYLLKNGKKIIDLAFVTHLHTDHYEGIKTLCQMGMVRKLCIYEGYKPTENKILSECHIDRKDLIYVTSGDVITVGDASFYILSPKKHTETEYSKLIQDEEDENNMSLMIKVVYHGVTALMTGDIGFDGEDSVIAAENANKTLRSDIIKIGHHGSRYSTSDMFLEAVSPEAAVIQVGKNNYGHPSPETLKRLSDHNIHTFRNDQSGAIGIKIKRRSTLFLKDTERSLQFVKMIT